MDQKSTACIFNFGNNLFSKMAANMATKATYISVTVNNTNLMLLPILTEIWSKNRLVTFLILKELPFQDGDQCGRQIGKNINISNQKQTKISKFHYTNLLTSFHNAMKYGTTLNRSLSTLRCLWHGYST